MVQITLKIKDSSNLSFFMQLIKQLDFVEVENSKKLINRRIMTSSNQPVYGKTEK
jgi:hypothetical protein